MGNNYLLRHIASESQREDHEHKERNQMKKQKPVTELLRTPQTIHFAYDMIKNLILPNSDSGKDASLKPTLSVGRILSHVMGQSKFKGSPEHYREAVASVQRLLLAYNIHMIEQSDGSFLVFHNKLLTVNAQVVEYVPEYISLIDEDEDVEQFLRFKPKVEQLSIKKNVKVFDKSMNKVVKKIVTYVANTKDEKISKGTNPPKSNSKIKYKGPNYQR